MVKGTGQKQRRSSLMSTGSDTSVDSKKDTDVLEKKVQGCVDGDGTAASDKGSPVSNRGSGHGRRGRHREEEEDGDDGASGTNGKTREEMDGEKEGRRRATRTKRLRDSSSEDGDQSPRKKVGVCGDKQCIPL